MKFTSIVAASAALAAVATPAAALNIFNFGADAENGTYTVEITGTGKLYQVETNYYWDDRPDAGPPPANPYGEDSFFSPISRPVAVDVTWFAEIWYLDGWLLGGFGEATVTRRDNLAVAGGSNDLEPIYRRSANPATATPVNYAFDDTRSTDWSRFGISALGGGFYASFQDTSGYFIYGYYEFTDAIGRWIPQTALVTRPDGTIIEYTITLADVPEPASWAMLLAGFGLVGLAARRHKAAVA